VGGAFLARHHRCCSVVVCLCSRGWVGGFSALRRALAAAAAGGGSCCRCQRSLGGGWRGPAGTALLVGAARLAFWCRPGPLPLLPLPAAAAGAAGSPWAAAGAPAGGGRAGSVLFAGAARPAFWRCSGPPRLLPLPVAAAGAAGSPWAAAGGGPGGQRAFRGRRAPGVSALPRAAAAPAAARGCCWRCQSRCFGGLLWRGAGAVLLLGAGSGRVAPRARLGAVVWALLAA